MSKAKPLTYESLLRYLYIYIVEPQSYEPSGKLWCSYLWNVCKSEISAIINKRQTYSIAFLLFSTTLLVKYYIRAKKQIHNKVKYVKSDDQYQFYHIFCCSVNRSVRKSGVLNTEVLLYTNGQSSEKLIRVYPWRLL